MKAFKLASAFAVTGLALAVSGQAMAADTTTDWTWAGEVSVESVLMDNLAGAVGNSGVAGTRGTLGVTSDLTVSIDVANGGFSATMDIEAGSASDGGTESVPSVTVSDFLYEEGAFMFGEVSTIIASEGYVSGMDTESAGSYDVDGGFRYTSGSFKVQAEANAATIMDDEDDGNVASDQNADGARDLGLAVAYAGDFEGGSFVVDAQYGEVPTGLTVATGDTASAMYYGFGVTMAASDAVSVMAGYTSGLGAETAMGLRADYTADAFTAYASYISNSADADADMDLGVAATVGAFALTADYDTDGVLDLGASTEGTSGAMSYSASLDLADVTGTMTTDYSVGAGFDAGAVQYAASYATANDMGNSTLGLSATHTTEGGAVLALSYDKDDNAGDEVDAIVATASYSF